MGAFQIMEVGERGNATSTGPMVPVLASNDEHRSRAVLTLLEAHGIPAMLDADIDGAFVGFHDPVPPGWFQVLVPTSMRSAALRLLREHEGDVERRGPPNATLHVASVPPWRSESTDVAAAAVPDEDHLRMDEDGEAPRRMDAELSRPVEERLRWALLAILFGVLAQELLATWFGERSLILSLAAKAPLGAEVYRLLTAGFLHGGLSHLFSNAALGLVFGVALFGTHGMGATAFVWSAASAVGLYSEVQLSSDILVIGASAGNYGLVGLWAHGQLQRASLERLPRRERLKTIGILLLLLPGALAPFSYNGTRVAVLAHVAGFISGVGLGTVFRRRLRAAELGAIETRSAAAGWMAVVFCGIGWAMGVARLAGM